MQRDVLISRVPLFETLPAEEVALWADTLHQRRFPAGSLLFAEGELGDRLYIILDGLIAIVKAIHTADERVIGLRGQGELIGEMSFFNDDGRRTASARAHTNVLMLELSRAEFMALLQRHPTLAFGMIRVLSRRLSDSNNLMIRDLHEKNERLTQAYAELKTAQAQIIEQETLARELQVAREIQESMLPRSLPQLPSYDLGGRMLPARQVGGDFYDVIRLGPQQVGLAIGDVSGKGVPAALFMALTCSLLRAEASRAASPEAALRAVNHHLSERNAKGMFVTVIYGVLDLPSRSFSYVRAGHHQPLVWDAHGRPQCIPIGRAHPLGLFPQPMLEAQTLRIPEGGSMLIYTDGVTEAYDEHGELFGFERLCALATQDDKASAQSLCDRLVDAVIAHHQSVPQSDDVTLLALHAYSFPS
jgi:serine phosphatase RsbU (regulator of sigma subunit)